MKVRFKVNNVDYELDGSISEISEFVNLATRETASNMAKQQPDRVQIQRRMPTAAEVASYIQNLDGDTLQHTVPQITQHFLGVTLDTRKDILLYNQIFARIQKAQGILEKKVHRKFYGMRQRAEN